VQPVAALLSLSSPMLIIVVPATAPLAASPSTHGRTNETQRRQANHREVLAVAILEQVTRYPTAAAWVRNNK
jgi:hypothetical protein